MNQRWFGTIRKTLSFNNRYFVIMSTVINNKGISYLVVLGIFLITITNVYAQSDERRQKEFNLDDDNIALQGYDVVSYFMGTPQKGNKSILYEYKGVIYWFNTTENLDLFKKQADKFEPVYGGWCAFALGDSGEKVKVDPKTFKIIDGNLYLFYNFYFNNTLIDWNKDEYELKKKADENWNNIINRP
jgi:YHS domain-containing protein